MVRPVGGKMENSTSQKVIDYLLSEIQNGNIQIGDKLPSERELSSRLQVSRSSVREAMAAFNIIGMVQVKPQGKTTLQSYHMAGFMNTLSPLFMMNENIHQEILDYRLCIEKQAINLAMKQDISKLANIIDLMKQYDSENLAEELDVLFHITLVECSNNSLLVQSIHGVMKLLEHSVKSNRSKEKTNLEELSREHEAIVQAMLENKCEVAQNLMENHLKREERESSL